MTEEGEPLTREDLELLRQLSPEASYSRNISQKVSDYQGGVIAGSYAKWVQDCETKLFDLGNTLKGGFYNQQKKEWDIDEKCKIMNDLGVRMWVGFVGSTYLDKNLFMSKLNNERIMDKCRYTGRRLIKLLMVNRKAWELDSKNLLMVVFLTLDIIEFAMRRAEAGNEKMFMASLGTGAFQFDEDEIRGKKGKFKNIL